MWDEYVYSYISIFSKENVLNFNQILKRFNAITLNTFMWFLA